MTLEEKILLLRKRSGFSQEELAEKLAVSRQAISRWESGETQPDAEHLLSLSDLFGVTVDALLRPDRELFPSNLTPQQTRKPKNAFWATYLTAFGAAGSFLLWLASTVIRSYEPYSYQDDTGRIWQSSRPGYSYTGFIDQYHLTVVQWMFFLALFVGLCLLLVRRIPEPQTKETQQTDSGSPDRK